MEEGTLRAGVAEVEWALLRTRRGDATLRLGGRLAHSRYDERRDAEAWARRVGAGAECDLSIVVGAGLGHGVLALEALCKGRVLVWEPFPGVAEAVRDVSSTFRARCVHGPEELDAALVDLAPGRARVIVHPGYEHVARFESRYAARALRRRLDPTGGLAMEERVVSPRALAALEALPDWATVEDLAGCLTDRTAIIASAGPSLDKALPALAGRRGGVVLACVQVLDRLADAHVDVDFAVSADPGNLFRRRRVRHERYRWLLADSSSRPDMLAQRADRTCIYHLRTPHLHDEAWRRCGLPVLDAPCLTVSEVSLLLAHRLGARRFVLTGVDLVSDDPRYAERFRTRDTQGEIVPTNSHYFHAARCLDWLARGLAAAGCELLRVGGGLPISGVRPVSTEALAEDLVTRPRWSPPQPERRHHPERTRVVREVLAPLTSAPLPDRLLQAFETRRAREVQPGRRLPAGSEPLEPSEIPPGARRVLASLEASARA